MNYSLFLENPAYTPFYAYNSKKRYASMIFGMSHARIDINETLLKGSFYNFACDSTDLYYQKKLIDSIEGLNGFGGVKTVYTEMPYNYFNYDVSMIRYTFYIRTRPFYEMDDYHHFKETDEGKTWINAYGIMSDMSNNVSKNRARIEHRSDILKKRFRYYRRKNYRKVWQEEEIEYIRSKIDHVWTTIRKDTIDENKSTWDAIIRFFSDKGIHLCIICTPSNPVFRESYRHDVQEMKELF